MSAKRFMMLIGVIMLLVGGLVVAPFVVSANNDLLKLQNDDTQWVMQRKNYSNWGYSTLNQIKRDNLKDLHVAWSFSTGVNQPRGHEGGPLVVGTTMYVHSSYPNHVYALDLTKEGAPIKWKYTPKQSDKALPVACCDWVHRGVQYAEGKILMATLDGQIIGLDANTGKELWKTKSADPLKGETITGAGIVIHDKYIQGVSGAEFGVRCWVDAYNINTGKRVWRSYSMGPDADVNLAPDFNSANPHYGRFGLGTSTWPGDQWKVGGGSTWGYWSYDPELNLVYTSTGNPGTWNPTPRKGDNKWSMTIFARNPDTGAAKWAYQMTPWDAWDYDGVNETILTTQMFGGKATKVLTHFDRNGFAYTLDRTNGTLLVAEPFVFLNWAKGIDMKTGRPIENPEKRTKQGVDTKDICPCAMGGKDQQPAGYSPRTNLFYSPTNNMCMNYEGVLVQYTAGAPYVGANLLMFPGRGGNWGEFIAWDGVKGKKVWGVREPFPAWGGALVTATDLVFYGTMDGWLKAVDAVSGQVLWKHKVGSGIIGNPMTYIGPDGKQYVAVLSGVGGWFGAIVSLDIPPDDPFGALGEVGAAYAAGLDKATTKGGILYVFGLD
ncbi:MAG: methanol/ethanol family PQQ-dependent dehydrogenase [candidate division NC10 bacterium]|nr:methanol/ethanol family PQQ-dependent dehydrogenase [candidate division NC10 bacterium]